MLNDTHALLHLLHPHQVPVVIIAVPAGGDVEREPVVHEIRVRFPQIKPDTARPQERAGDPIIERPIGRDHTGVGGFYAPEANQKLFEKLGEIGVTPVFIDPVGYDEELDRYVPLSMGNGVKSISGTAIRRSLSTGSAIPEWTMRSVVQEVLQTELAAGRPIFQE